MSYPLLRQGDDLPAVGVLQKLLNRTGATLDPDGAFGPLTKAAVQAFQRPRGLSPDGVVGENTWPRVSAGAQNLRVIDCVDVFDPSLSNLEERDIRRAGGNPIVIGGMSGGVEQAVNEILRAAAPGTVFLLRFHGHGAPGVAGISFGQGVPGEHHAALTAANLTALRPVILRLRPIFGPYGCVQFMHCSTGRGPSGRAMLQNIANDLGVPASAGVVDQLGGGLTTFRFEGPTFTAVPGGATLRDWCRGRPDRPGMTVA